MFLERKGRPRAAIIGTGSYLPDKLLTNQDLEQMVATSDDWIKSRTGMKERRIARPDEYTSDMAVAAARKAIDAAHILASDIDLILCATLTSDFPFPSTACLIQFGLGASRAAALDIQAACSGYIYALSIAKAYIESGEYRTILLVASEKLSSIVNYQDRNTCVLFGDGAAACVISDRSKGVFIEKVLLGADGEQAELLMIPAGGSRHPATHETVDKQLHFIHMDGKEVYKHAVRRMEEVCKELLGSLSIGEEEVAWLIPHQANGRIIDLLAERLKIPIERIYITIHKYGNTSASSVGIALDELLREGWVKEGENILMAAFGSGFTWGASLLRYEK